MDYRRYALGTYARNKWVVCNDCGNPDKPHPVWQGSEREVNFAMLVNAVMEHEIRIHLSRPAVKK